MRRFENILAAGPQSDHIHHGDYVGVLDGVFSPDGNSIAVADIVSGGDVREGSGRGEHRALCVLGCVFFIGTTRCQRFTSMLNICLPRRFDSFFGVSVESFIP